MKENNGDSKFPVQSTGLREQFGNKVETGIAELKLYPSSEYIYSKPKEKNEKSFEDDVSGDDLDIPGSELDDDQEKIGSEDEENNYYSIGGDNHNDLEDDDRD